MSSVDVLIIAALPEEYEATRTAGNGVTQWQERDSGSSAPYLVGAYPTSSGRNLSVALARPTGMGGRKTGPFAATLIQTVKPTCLAMSGVCAGSPDDTAPGDVVVASLAYEYDEGKHNGSKFRPSAQQYPLNDRWLRAAQDFRPDDLPTFGAAGELESAIWLLERLHKGQDPRNHPARIRYFPRGTWSQRLETLEADGQIALRDGKWELTGAGTARIERVLAGDVDGPDRLPFAVLTGPMASGSSVVEDSRVWSRLKDQGVRKILALEMEAATIATAAHDNNVPHWLVAKGVMDHANPDKDDRFKEFAARASADVLFALLGRLLDGSPATVVATEPTPARFSPGAKLQFTRRLGYDWQDLADLIGVPPFERARFAPGNESRALWEWLEVRGRLSDLPAALDEIGRSDLRPEQ